MVLDLSYIYPMTSSEVRVIFIDDDKFVRESTSQSLEMEGFAVDKFSDASKALAIIDINCASIIVTDIKMPGMTGLDLLQQVKAIDAHIPVILITGQGDIAMAVQAMQDGAYDFLEKPFMPDNLIEVVRRAYDRF